MSERTTFASLFAVPDYRRLWGIGAGVGVARWLELLALAIFAYEITRSPPLVALLAIVRMVPYVLLGFVVGALADFLDRRRLLILSFALATLAAGGLTLVAATGLAGYWTAVLAAVASGLVWTIDMPVRRRLMVDIAGTDRMSAALGFDNSTAYATRALGPIAGGAIYQWIGIQGVFALSALVFAICLMLSLGLTRGARADDGTVVATPSLGILLIPPRELVTNRAFLIVLGVTAVYNIWCFPFITMVPVIAQKDFALTPVLVGLLSASDGIGGTIGAIAVGMLGSQRTLFRTYYWGTFACLVLLLWMAFLLIPVSFVAGLLLTGAAAACFSATQYALVYTIAPVEMRGRATGFLSIFIGLATVGFLNTGWLFANYASADAMRLMALQGLVPLALLGLLWWRGGSGRSIERQD